MSGSSSRRESSFLALHHTVRNTWHVARDKLHLTYGAMSAMRHTPIGADNVGAAPCDDAALGGGLAGQDAGVAAGSGHRVPDGRRRDRRLRGGVT